MVSKFEDFSIRMVTDLGHAFGFSPDDVYAICGNMGEESGGLLKLQEEHPLPGTGQGGLGGFQWTGPRRLQFQAFCSHFNIDVSSYEATEGFLAYELSTTQKAAVTAVKNANGLYAKVLAFMNTFERPNAAYAHPDSRYQWALKAKAAWEAHPGAANTPIPVLDKSPKPAPAPEVIPVPEPKVSAGHVIATGTAGAVIAIAAHAGIPWLFLGIFGAFVGAIVLLSILGKKV